MPALSHMRVNREPKLDPRKAKMMRQQMHGLIADSTRAIDTRGLLGQNADVMTRGVQLMQSMHSATQRSANAPLPWDDALARTAEAMGCSSGRLAQVLAALSQQGADAPQTLQLMQRFSDTATDETAPDVAFVQALQQLATPQQAEQAQQIFATPQRYAATHAAQALHRWTTQHAPQPAAEPAQLLQAIAHADQQQILDAFTSATAPADSTATATPTARPALMPSASTATPTATRATPSASRAMPSAISAMRSAPSTSAPGQQLAQINRQLMLCVEKIAEINTHATRSYDMLRVIADALASLNSTASTAHAQRGRSR